MLQNRTYFFNVKENRMGDLYLNIVESKNRETSGFERQSVILFADDLQDFLKGFDESLRVLEKAIRERKRAGPARAPRSGDREHDAPRGEGQERSESRERSGHQKPGGGERGEGRGHSTYRKYSGDERGGGRRAGKENAKPGEKPEVKRPRRVVVRKHGRDD
jgi:hypothetical protein